MDIEVRRVVCDCGGVLDLPLRPPSPPATYGSDDFPTPLTWVSNQALKVAELGAHPTPLLRWTTHDDVWLKCDQLLPTGSFKDRGALMLTGLAVQLGSQDVVIDSSGNAAAALAAHAARAGLRCTVFVPAGASVSKLRQIASYGANLRRVEGPREAAGAAARDFARTSHALYASHSMNPYFHEGTKSWLYEVLAERPDVRTLVLPVGSGSLLLGVLRGLEELTRSGWISQAPRLVLAQAAGYTSLAESAPTGAALPSPGRGGGLVPPLAEGIAIRHPARREQIRNWLTKFQSTLRVVDSADIIDAQRELGLGGFYVEPTSAAAWAAWHQESTTECTVVALTGHGLKAA